MICFIKQIFKFFLNIKLLSNVWNVKEFERITNTIEEYKDIFPFFIKEYLLGSVVLPKLFEAIDSWQPAADKVLINEWIFPW